MHMTAHTDDRSLHTTATHSATLLAEAGGELWQQPALIPTPGRTGSRPTKRPRTNEHLRQVGLSGIAQARAALAEANRKVREASEHRAA